MSDQQLIVPSAVPAIADDLEARAKEALDNLARDIGRSAVNHLKAMYPEALAAVTANAERSLTNHVRNEINDRMRPILRLLIEAHRTGVL